MSSFIDKLADKISGPLFNCILISLIIILNLFTIAFGFGVRLLGPLFVIGFYALLGLHVYAYFAVIMFVIKKRLGTIFGLVWIAIGLSLLYNIIYNHFFATVIKAGSPSDLKVYFK